MSRHPRNKKDRFKISLLKAKKRNAWRRRAGLVESPVLRNTTKTCSCFICSYYKLSKIPKKSERKRLDNLNFQQFHDFTLNEHEENQHAMGCGFDFDALYKNDSDLLLNGLLTIEPLLKEDWFSSEDLIWDDI